jgi:hypothetical protein
VSSTSSSFSTTTEVGHASSDERSVAIIAQRLEKLVEHWTKEEQERESSGSASGSGSESEDHGSSSSGSEEGAQFGHVRDSRYEGGDSNGGEKSKSKSKSKNKIKIKKKQKQRAQEAGTPI